VTYTEAGEPKHIRCKLLVGADGYFSAVRQQCLEDGPPDFAVSPDPPSVPPNFAVSPNPPSVPPDFAVSPHLPSSLHGRRSARASPWRWKPGLPA